jgi:hypothetical protein
MKREFKFTLDGRIATRFLNVLQRDIDFDLEQPITDTYMFEVGNEIGMEPVHGPPPSLLPTSKSIYKHREQYGEMR